MALKALVHGSRVCQVEPMGGDFPVAAPLKWVTCGDEVTPQWTYNGSSFVAPPTPPPVARGRDFRRALVTLVDGAPAYPVSGPTQGQFDRAAALWADPDVAALMAVLDNEALSPVSVALIERFWAKLKPRNVPSAAEVARCEAAAPSFGFSLVPHEQ